jgi:polyphosphate glucokinase
VKLQGGTLCIDIGGSHIKGMVLDPEGQPLSEKVRLETPRPATPKAVQKTIERMLEQIPGFERVSVGFPGVVIDGVIQTAPNLDGDWADTNLGAAISRLTSRPTRVANDADIQGLGVVEGKGVEMVITLGTGMGSGIYLDGKLVPNLELGHHPLKKKMSYEEYVSAKTLEEIGEERWVARVGKVIAQIQPIWNPRMLYVGGGNAKKLAGTKLPDNVRLIDNVAGIVGGLRLWS